MIPQGNRMKLFDGIEDPRRHNIRNLLHDILMIALCAVISGADSWSQVDIAGFEKITLLKILEYSGIWP
jgi:hypothetical protein